MFRAIVKSFVSNIFVKKTNVVENNDDDEYLRLCEYEEIENIFCELIEAIEIFGLKLKYSNYSITINTWKFYFDFYAVVENGKTEFSQMKKIESYLQDFRRVVDNEKLMITTENRKLCFELPKPDQYKKPFYFSEMMKDENLVEEMKDYKLPFVTGIDGKNNLLIEDICKMPHMLIAGTTGSGKSVFLNNIICGLMSVKTGDDVKFAFIDPKCVELTPYKKCKKYLFDDVVTNNIDLSIELMKKVYEEMHYRNEKLEKYGVKNIDGLERLGMKMERLVMIIDEFSNVAKDTKAKNVFSALVESVTQMGRACGIHLILCTQIIRSKVVEGTIKGNLPCRISFSLPSSIDSRTILDENGAECLDGKGDGIIKHNEGKYRFQSPFITEIENERIIMEYGI